jgi:hypothetical protein
MLFIILIIILLTLYFWSKKEAMPQRPRTSRRRDRRERPPGYPQADLLGSWRGTGSIPGYYTTSYIDYNEYRAVEINTGDEYIMQVVNQMDVFIEDRFGKRVKGTMQRDSSENIYEIQGSDFTLRKEV